MSDPNPNPRPQPRPAQSLADKILSSPDDLDLFVRGLERLKTPLSARVNADPHNVERGLAQLVLTLIDLLRQLMERQALRRMEGGSLTDHEVEQLGQTFMLLEQRMQELKKTFGLEDKDLNLDLGPLGKLL